MPARSRCGSRWRARPTSRSDPALRAANDESDPAEETSMTDKRITPAELNRRLADLSIPESELAAYFVVDDERAGGAHAVVGAELVGQHLLRQGRPGRDGSAHGVIFTWTHWPAGAGSGAGASRRPAARAPSRPRRPHGPAAAARAPRATAFRCRTVSPPPAARDCARSGSGAASVRAACWRRCAAPGSPSRRRSGPRPTPAAAPG